jgi:hypothetical protein
MATRTTAALACSLGILFVLTRATGQPLTVALLGVVITMIAARSVKEPDPHQQRITMALLPVPQKGVKTAESRDDSPLETGTLAEQSPTVNRTTGRTPYAQHHNRKARWTSSQLITDTVLV